MVQKALSHANKKTMKLIGFIRLHTENGGIFAHRDLSHNVDSVPTEKGDGE